MISENPSQNIFFALLFLLLLIQAVARFMLQNKNISENKKKVLKLIDFSASVSSKLVIIPVVIFMVTLIAVYYIR